jgi:hypothetical protein
MSIQDIDLLQRTKALDPTKPSSVLPKINELQLVIVSQGIVVAQIAVIQSSPLQEIDWLTPVLLECLTKQSIRLEAQRLTVVCNKASPIDLINHPA